MEKTVIIDPQEQTSTITWTRVVTPEKGKRNQESPDNQPPTKIAKTEPEVEVVSEHRIPIRNYWEFSSAAGFEHLDHRWLRTAWWHKFERKWYPRDPSKPIIWARPDDWKPESDKEFAERSKSWVKEGERLEHEKVQVGGIYRLFENPACKVRVTDLNRYRTKPEVYVQNLAGYDGRDLFTDELESTLLNSKRARKNWVRRRRARYRKFGEPCYW